MNNLQGILVLILFSIITICNITDNVFGLEYSFKEYKIVGMDSCKIQLEIEIEGNSFRLSEKKRVFIVINNSSSNEISIPKWFSSGFYEDKSIELCFEIQMETENGYIFVDNKDIDYSFFTYNRENIVLKPDERKRYKENIEFVHYLDTVGNYRIRATLRLPEFINCKEIVSIWQEFKVVEGGNEDNE